MIFLESLLEYLKLHKVGVSMRSYLLLEGETRVNIVIGKGGTGKTTISAALSIILALRGYKTLIVSLDPAHNLGDVLGTPLKDSPKEIAENLYAMELDMENIIAKYLKNLEKSMKSMYKYLTTINLEKYFEILSFSPGIEEYATLDAISEILKEKEKWDVIIFDTPPTGLTLRVLGLPRISIIWTEKLIDLRRKILEKRHIIEKIKGEVKIKLGEEEVKIPTKEEEDPVLRELKSYYDEVKRVHDILRNPKITTVIGVMNLDRLSFYEISRAFDTLKRFEIPMKLLVINKVLEDDIAKQSLPGIAKLQEEVYSEVVRRFRNLDIEKIGLLQEEPRGIEALSKIGKMVLEGL